MPKRKTKTPSGKRQITERDMAILRQTAEHGMITFEAMQKCHFAGKKKDAVKSTLRRLQSDSARLLQSERLDSRRVYYHLTRRATKLLGISLDRAKPLGLQAVIRRYALLWFICLADDAHRKLCRIRDYPQFFPIGNHRLPQANFYLEERIGEPEGQQTIRFGFVLVDHDAHHRRIVQRATKALKRFLKHGWFDDLIRSGAFELTILTLTDGKKRSIEAAMTKNLRKVLAADLLRIGLSTKEAFPIAISIHVVPGLIDLIPGRNHKGNSR